MWVVNDGEWPRSAGPEYAWELFGGELARMSIGDKYQVHILSHWSQLQRRERFDDLAFQIGGYTRLALQLSIPADA